MRGTQAAQLGASGRELLAQFGHLVLPTALGGDQFGAALADGEPVAHEISGRIGGAPSGQADHFP